jgi:hypothetical protein
MVLPPWQSTASVAQPYRLVRRYTNIRIIHDSFVLPIFVTDSPPHQNMDFLALLHHSHNASNF